MLISTLTGSVCIEKLSVQRAERIFAFFRCMLRLRPRPFKTESNDNCSYRSDESAAPPKIKCGIDFFRSLLEILAVAAWRSRPSGGSGAGGARDLFGQLAVELG